MKSKFPQSPQYSTSSEKGLQFPWISSKKKKNLKLFFNHIKIKGYNYTVIYIFEKQRLVRDTQILIFWL